MTFDQENVTFPNRVVEGAKLTNFTHMRQLRRRIAVGLEYGTDIERGLERLVELANQHEEVLDDPLPQAFARMFGASSVDLELRFWVDPVKSSPILVQSQLITAIHSTFRAEDLPIAFPHMQLVQATLWEMAGSAADR